MRAVLRFLVVTLSVFAVVGCDSFRSLTGAKKTAQGSPYEVLVVCDGYEWDSPLGAELKALLETPVEMLNQVEPMFNVVRITARDFRHLLPSYRNILKVLCSPDITETAILAQYDVVASPQIVLTFQGPSIAAMCDYLKQNGASLLQVLEIAERNRSIAYANKQGAKDVERKIKEEFDVDMHISNGFTTRAKSDNFVWSSNEFPVASQGFFIYSHPFKGKSSVTTEALVKARNEFAKRIPGPVDNSYMTTVKRIPNVEDDGYVPFMPQRKVVKINGREWIELRGFWEVENDFMGGPFVSYTTLDERTGELLTLDCYVYSPKYGKRNFLRPLEHLVYGVSFPNKENQENK
ncbi:MAG: DUF4837 family protein [Alistipes sp.]|nr:DUF4837 family protein [Alistipes sp.]